MKPLLNKTTLPFLIYVLIVFVISVPAYYWVIDTIWKEELDEHNQIVANSVQHQFTQLKRSDVELQKSIDLWNEIQPNSILQKTSANDNLKDSVYIEIKQNPYAKSEDIDRFRSLSTIIYIKNKPYRFVTQINIEETDETIGVIALITVVFFIVIVVGLLILTRKLSKNIWRPFYETLRKLKSFNLNRQFEIEFDKTDILEFAGLNDSLQKLIKHNVSAYKSQKEFTENASHELQTPLAVLKNKLDILLQSKDLTEKQYHIVEEMNKALIRSSRINKNLLLLTKIENSQFDNSELLRLDTLVAQSMEGLQEHFNEKSINIGSKIQENIEVKGNSGLTEVLINNLIINAIRHTSPGGAIRVELSKSGLEVRNSGQQPLNTRLLFKRFSRMSANNSGSGLGLAIVQEICRLQGWMVTYRFSNSEHIFFIRI